MLTQGERSELILDRYRLGQRVGAGAAGSVHAAEDTQLGQSVVIKLFDGQADGFSAWHDEMRLILRMSHPNIVPCLDIGFDERLGMWTLVFARQQGGSLRRWMVDPARTEPLPIRDILRDVASALSFAHRKGVIHRDVKAENILAEQASAGTRWLLCDFGSGRFLTHGSRAQSLAGSAFYMAPEVFTGEATALSDQYSLGVLGIELLTKTLLHEQDLQRFVSQHRGQPTLHGVLAQLVEKDPLLRYPNLDSFLALLNQRESTMVENSSEDLLLTEYLQTRRNQTAQQIDELKKQWAGEGAFAEFLVRHQLLDRTASKTLMAIRKGYLVGNLVDIRRTLGLPAQSPPAIASSSAIAAPSAIAVPSAIAAPSAIAPPPVSAPIIETPSEVLVTPAETSSSENPVIEIKEAEPLKAGTVLDRYPLEEVLGEGSTATIYRSYHKLLKMPVAIKVYKREALSRAKGGTERILEEGQMMIRLDHPNIVRVLDIALHEGVPYIVFEYVSEMSLQDLIDNIGRLPAERVAQVGAQVSAALAVTSAEGLLHRDVKPENILVRKDGQVKLADFGIATHRDADGRTADKLARAGLISGTPQYIAPEQIRTPDQIDFRADMYCLGATLFHAATGHPPFTSDTLDEMLNAHLSTTPLLVGALVPGFDPQLAELIARLLRKHPAERPSSFEELHQSFEQVSDRILTQQSTHRQSVISTQVSAIQLSETPSSPPQASAPGPMASTQLLDRKTPSPPSLATTSPIPAPITSFLRTLPVQQRRAIGVAAGIVLFLILLAVILSR